MRKGLLDIVTGNYTEEESAAVLSIAELGRQVKDQVRDINSAATTYIAAQIDADGMLLVDRLVRAGHPYGIASEQWLLAVRLEQLRRVAALEAGVEDFSAAMLDFGSFGDKPYTVVQLMMAAGLGG